MFFIRFLPILATTATAAAGEIVTLDSHNPGIEVAATDTVQVLGIIKGATARRLVFARPQGVKWCYITIPAGDGEFMEAPMVMTGLEEVRLPSITAQDNVAVTLKITGTGEEIASEPVVMPAATGESFNVGIETSTDLVNWTPGAPGDYLASTSQRYFRLTVKKTDE